MTRRSGGELVTELELAPETSDVRRRLAATARPLGDVLELADQADDLGATRSGGSLAWRAAVECRMWVVEPPPHPLGRELADESALGHRRVTH